MRDSKPGELLMRKSIFLASTVAAVAMAAAGGAALAAGGGFGSPGTTTFHDVFANTQLSDSSGNLLFISVDRGIQTFKARHTAGPPVMVGPETVLNYSGNAPDGTFFGGCFVIPDSAFVVGGSLATASLNVDPSIETPCPGFLIPAGAGGRPGIGGVVPDAGGGGGGGTPLTANLVWTSNGAVTVFNGTTDSRCQQANARTVFSSSNTFASVSGSAAGLVGLTSQFSQISISDSREVITSAFSAACTGA
jgi:hypothetical protein